MSIDAHKEEGAGWDAHVRFQLTTGTRMSFRARLRWLEEADRMVRFLATKRRWIDKNGVVHELPQTDSRGVQPKLTTDH